MISNFYFQVYGLFFIIFLLFMYFSKKRLVSVGNDLYIALIIANVISLLLGALSISTVLSFKATSIISIVAAKLYLLSIIIWIFLLTEYVYIISFKKMERLSKIKDLSLKKILVAIAPIGLICLAALCALPIDIIDNGNIIKLDGNCFYFTYIISIGCMLFWLYRYITSLNYIKGEKSNFILFLVIFSLINVIMQLAYSDFLFLAYTMYLITFITYFSIDNPDLDLMYQLEQAKKQAAEAEVSKTNALLKASHEIRTPLNTIIGFSQSMLEDTNVKEDIEYIKTASQNLLSTVNNILEIPSEDNQEFKLIYGEYNVDVLIKQIEALAKLKMEDKKINFEVNIDDSIPSFLYGDSIRLKQVVLNILYNAIKHTKEGYINFKVNSITIGNICRLIISVKDTGVGISEDKLGTLFDERIVETVKIREENHDTDLNLNLMTIKKLVEAMNGQITVESEYREGTLVKISIDQKIVDKVPEGKELKNEEPKKDDFTGKKVLIVDDDKLNLKVASRLLKKYNVTIDEASNGLECLQKINDGEKYDLIFLDDWMPNMSGVETLKQLDKTQDFNTPVVAITANATSGMKETYLKQGFNDYISKPIERKELHRVLEKFLK